MLLQKEQNTGMVSIKGYQPGKINITGQVYQVPVLVFPDRVAVFEGVNLFSEFNIEQLIPLVSDDTEIVIIGSGEKHQFINAQEMKKITDKGIAIEVMASRQACHTFQVLLHEKRKVLGVVFP